MANNGVDILHKIFDLSNRAEGKAAEPKALDLKDGNLSRVSSRQSVEAPPLLKPQAEQASFVRPASQINLNGSKANFTHLYNNETKNISLNVGENSRKIALSNDAKITLEHNGEGSSTFQLSHAAKSTIINTDSKNIKLRDSQGNIIGPSELDNAYVAKFGENAKDVSFEPYYGKLEGVHKAAEAISEAAEPANKVLGTVAEALGSAEEAVKELGAFAGTVLGMKEAAKYISKSNNSKADNEWTNTGAIKPEDAAAIQEAASNVQLPQREPDDAS